MHALVLALVLIGSEQSYGPYTRPVNGGDVAVAPARGGALIAWSEANRIHVAMLDAHARLGETIRTLPATSERAIAVAPAVASSGSGFLVAWLELGIGVERVMAARVGLDGTPLGTPRQYGAAEPVGTSAFAVRTVWDGAAWRLWASGYMHEIDTGGNVLAMSYVGTMPHSVAASGRVVGTSSWRATVHCGFGWCSRTLDLVWTAGEASGALRVWASGAFGSITQMPSVSANTAADNRFAVTWASSNGVNYFLTGEGTRFVFANPETSASPGIACNDTQCLIAYGQAGDVHAFTFALDRLTGPQLLTIAATERTERAPQMVALSPERFLVMYRSDGSDGARMNWRIVSFEPPRRRALR